MKRIRAGIQVFHDRIFPARREHFEMLARGQQPPLLLFTCSDARIDPSLFTQTQPGEIFVVRNAGNLVPAYGAGSGAEAAAVEYALRVLRVPHVAVCGHSHCGALAALREPGGADGLPEVDRWLEHARPALERTSAGPSLGDPLLDLAGANVRLQLEHLRTHPAVAEAEGRGEADLHGWIYRLERGEVLELGPDGGFRPIGAETPRSAGAAG